MNCRADDDMLRGIGRIRRKVGKCRRCQFDQQLPRECECGRVHWCARLYSSIQSLGQGANVRIIHAVPVAELRY
ncbi:hypothetical protein ASF64_01895 [Arthrobacter sp. Leaf137]|nr:hypothetical protein ASF64_01895 [Arthrobacter sp. Leaf137]